MKNYKPLLLIVAVAFAITACGHSKTSQQERLNFVAAQSSVDRDFMIKLIGSLKDSNEIVKIEAFDNKPIQINAKSFTVRAPLDLQAVFNSAAFRIDYGHLFPQTTNGWDAFIAVLSSAERIASSPIPWLTSAIVKTSGKGITINGNENADLAPRPRAAKCQIVITRLTTLIIRTIQTISRKNHYQSQRSSKRSNQRGRHTHLINRSYHYVNLSPWRSRQRS